MAVQLSSQSVTSLLLKRIQALEQRCDDQERRLEEHENRYEHKSVEVY